MAIWVMDLVVAVVVIMCLAMETQRNRIRDKKGDLT
jgi:hypothetical protein